MSAHDRSGAGTKESETAARRSREQAVGGWNAVAAGWARWWAVFERAAQPVSDRLVELAHAGPGQTVLDLATGLGEPALTAARRVGPQGRVIATDSSPAMLREAAARARLMGLSNLTFREMDAERPDIEDLAVDAILCRWGLMFVPDLDGCLRRLRALLKPGGRFATAAWGEPDEVPMIRTSAQVLAARVPLPQECNSPLNAFRLSETGLLDGLMRRAGFAEVKREPMRLVFEFNSAAQYTRFRRDVSNIDAMLADHYPPAAIEAAWQAVSDAAQAQAGEDGRLRLVNTAVCFAGRR